MLLPDGHRRQKIGTVRRRWGDVLGHLPGTSAQEEMGLRPRNDSMIITKRCSHLFPISSSSNLNRSKLILQANQRDSRILTLY
jgi:hypothetical protein